MILMRLVFLPVLTDVEGIGAGSFFDTVKESQK